MLWAVGGTEAEVAFPWSFHLQIFFSFDFLSYFNLAFLNDHQRVLRQKLSDKRGGPRNTAGEETGETKVRYGPKAQKM